MDAIICAEIIYLLSVKKQDLHTDHTEGNSLNSWISLDFELCTQYGSIMYAPAQIHFARFVQKGSEIDDGMAFPCFSHKVTRTLNTLKQYPVCLVSWTCSPCHLVTLSKEMQRINQFCQVLASRAFARHGMYGMSPHHPMPSTMAPTWASSVYHRPLSWTSWAPSVEFFKSNHTVQV